MCMPETYIRALYRRIHQRQRLAYHNYIFTLLLRSEEIIGSHNCRLAMAG